MQTTNRFWSGPRRKIFAALAAVVVALGLLALPPVRAAADSFLNIFRAQSVVFVPVDPARIEQLEQLKIDPQSLFLEQPSADEPRAEPRKVGSLLEASSAAGFAVEQPAAFLSPPTAQEFVVQDRHRAQFRVNVAGAQALLTQLGIDDVTLPEALGSGPIVADIAPFVTTRYRGTGYDLALHQGRSPSVELPEGVDLAQVGKAALRLLGVEPAQAEAMSRSIDWKSTLLFPFPSNIGNIRQVTISGAPGLLVGGQEGQRALHLYWQRGDRIYMLESKGRISEADLIATAESVR